MKCSVLVSEKLSGVPLVECGGVVLQAGDKLIVSEALGEQMKKHYGKNLIVAFSEEKPSLKSGAFEYIAGGSKAVVQAAQHIGVEAPSVAAISSDKSMQGKMKARKKV